MTTRTYLSPEEIHQITRRVLAPIEPFDISLHTHRRVASSSTAPDEFSKYILITKESDKGKLEFAINFLDHCHRTELYEKALNAHLQVVQEKLKA